LSTPGIQVRKRIKMLSLAFFSFLIVNIIRILVLSVIAVSGSVFFDITHKIFWYSLSTLFVVAIWFAEIKFFKIKAIPFYSDIKFLYKNIKINR
jgi:exosortase/archaeosortase family protein